MAKKLLLGFTLMLFIGLGCFGFMYLNFIKEPNTAMLVTVITTLLLLGIYVILAFFSIRKNPVRESRNNTDKMHSFVFFVIASLFVVITSVLFAVFYEQIAAYFAVHESTLRLTISVLFAISIIFILFSRRIISSKKVRK